MISFIYCQLMLRLVPFSIIATGPGAGLGGGQYTAASKAAKYGIIITQTQISHIEKHSIS